MGPGLHRGGGGGVGGGPGEGDPVHKPSHCTPVPCRFLQGLMQGVATSTVLTAAPQCCVCCSIPGPTLQCRNGPFHPCNQCHMTVI